MRHGLVLPVRPQTLGAIDLQRAVRHAGPGAHIQACQQGGAAGTTRMKAGADQDPDPRLAVCSGDTGPGRHLVLKDTSNNNGTQDDNSQG